MKKITLTILMLFISSVVSFAQQASEEVVIKLKANNLEVRGYIIEDVKGNHITIKTVEGDVFSYRVDEIARIYNPNAALQKEMAKAKEKQDKELAKQAEKQARIDRREAMKLGNFKGYRGMVEVSFANGYGSNEDYSCVLSEWQLSIINGYNFGPHLFLGLGVGVETTYFTTYDYDDLWDETHFPVFLKLRYAFGENRRIAPYLSLNAGYSISISNTIGCYTIGPEEYGIYDYLTNASGFYAEPSIGLEIRTKQKNAIYFAATASILMRKEKNSFNTESYGFKLGVSF